MNYTKGDWKVTDSAFTRYTTYRGKASGARKFIAIVDNLDSFLEEVAEVQGDTQEEAEANANLIAAAPDMQKALTEIIRYFRSKMGRETISRTDSEVLNIGSKALAKAEGKEV